MVHGRPARIPHILKRLLRRGRMDILAHWYAAQGLGERYLLETSVALTTVKGGVKTNALPESAVLNINSRVEVRYFPSLSRLVTDGLAVDHPINRPA